MAFNGNGALEAANQPQVLDIAPGICQDDPLYSQLGCSCASGLITYDACTSAVPFCKNCTKVGMPLQLRLWKCTTLCW
jgi:uncharacterized protein YqkB